MADDWERAVAAALKGQPQLPRAITLDGAVKCPGGRLPSPSLFEGQLVGLEHLSIANVRLSSLEGFPRLPSLRRLVLSDNRISGGLQALVDAGLDALRDLDLSNNRIATLEDLTPLAKLRLESLDLYECPVTKTKGYRSTVFGWISSLKYLDKVDADGNERQDTDDEEDEDEDEEEEEEAGEEDEGEEVDNEGELEDGEGDEEEGEGEEEEEEEEDDNEEDDDEGDQQDGVEDDNATAIPKRKKENGESRNNGDGDQVEPQANGATLHKSSSGKRKREGADESLRDKST